jgi:hypothetical protein
MNWVIWNHLTQRYLTDGDGERILSYESEGLAECHVHNLVRHWNAARDYWEKRGIEQHFPTFSVWRVPADGQAGASRLPGLRDRWEYPPLLPRVPTEEGQ